MARRRTAVGGEALRAELLAWKVDELSYMRHIGRLVGGGDLPVVRRIAREVADLRAGRPCVTDGTALWHALTACRSRSDSIRSEARYRVDPNGVYQEVVDA